MQFVSSLANAIPVVGQIKAGVHYLAGDYDGASDAFYESTRSSALLIEGTVGSALGPVGSAGGALMAGAMVDGLASAGTGEKRGIFKNLDDISDDISSGNVPVASTLKTAAELSLDCVGGLGMGTISSEVMKDVGQTMGKEVVKQSAKGVGKRVGREVIQKSVKLTASELLALTSRELSKTTAKEVERKVVAASALMAAEYIAVRGAAAPGGGAKRKQKGGETSSKDTKPRQNNEASEKGRSGSRGGAGSGSQPPGRNPNGNSNPRTPRASVVFFSLEKLLRKWRDYFPELAKELLKIMKKLKRHQRDHLENVVNSVVRRGSTLDEIVVLTLLLCDIIKDKIDVMMFTDLMQFVSAVVDDRMRGSPVDRLNFCFCLGCSTDTALAYQNALLVSETIVAEFLEVSSEMNEIFVSDAIVPYFRDIYSAVYHYMKHRRIPYTGNEKLTVKQYHELIQIILEEIRGTSLFLRLSNSNNTYICDISSAYINWEARLVIKMRNSELVLASCYYLESDDEENDDPNK